MKFANCYSRRPRTALTLIEVAAGLSLLSVVLVASLIGIRRHERQWQLAAAKLQAAEAANQLLSDMVRTQGFLPIPQQGQVAYQDGVLLWQTEPLPLEPLGLSKMRLSLRRPEDQQALIAIEVLAPPTAAAEVRSP